VIAGGVVSWRGAKGARSVPIGGETDITCESGTTVLDKGGTRAFEVLQGAASVVYGCQPGAGGPVELRRDDVTRSWTARHLAAENGHVVLGAMTGRVPWHIVAWTPSGAVRAGTCDCYPSDGAVAADDRVALVTLSTTRSGKVLLFAPGDAGQLSAPRTLASFRDGYRNGSLQLYGSTVTWRGSDGAAHSAP